MTDAEDDDPPLDGPTMLLAARQIVFLLDRQLMDFGTEEVTLTREAGVLTVAFLNALIEALERGI